MSWQNNNNNQVTSLFSAGAFGSDAIHIPANGSIQPVQLIDVSLFSSYDLSFYVGANTQQNAGVALAFQVDLTWYDDLTSNIPVFQETWYPWVTSTYPSVATPDIVASGPMHGRFMTITMTNPGNILLGISYMLLFGSPRNLQLSDWRQNIGRVGMHDHTLVILPMGSPVPGNGYDNSLIDTGGLISVGVANFWFPLNLYAGPIDWIFQVGGGAVVASAEIVDVGTNYQATVSGSLNGTTGKIVAMPAGNASSGNVILPRGGCAFVISVTTAGTIAFKAVAQQGP